MRGTDQRNDTLFSYVRPDSRVPPNPLRPIRRITEIALSPGYLQSAGTNSAQASRAVNTRPGSSTGIPMTAAHRSTAHRPIPRSTSTELTGA
jgi:hypothetical protein